MCLRCGVLGRVNLAAHHILHRANEAHLFACILQNLLNEECGGGFAVGAGDADPWSRSTGALVIHTQLPCEFHLAHHGDATALGFQHERGAGVEHRGRHDVVHMVPVHVIKGVEIGLGLPLVDANHVGTAFPQYLRQRGAGHPQSGDHHCLIRYLHCSS